MTANVYELTDKELESLCSDPQTTTENLSLLKEFISRKADGKQIALIYSLIKNPNISFNDWCDIIRTWYYETDQITSKALENPSIILWLLENPAQFIEMPYSVAKSVKEVQDCPEAIKILCEEAIKKASNFIDPNNFMFRKGLRTRYATKIISF